MTTRFAFFPRVTIAFLVLSLTIFTTRQAQAVGEKIGLVTDEGGIADMSFNYTAYQGLLQAETDLGVVGTVYEPATSADYETELQQCVADGNELCFAVGFSMGDAINNVAAANPGTAFALLDFSFDTPPSNLRGILFNEKQVGYLAGALAGKMTTSNVIGVVGGMYIPPVINFVEGYRNGAQCVGAGANVLRNYTGTFTDPNLGAAVAADMISRGADVIFGAAGQTGNGAILHSAQDNVWSIGVDTDQYLTVFENGAVPGSGYLLTSAMKRLDTAVYDTIQDQIGGTFTSGTVTYSLADNGVGLAPYHEADDDIPQATKDYVNAVKAGILASTIDINYPCEPRFHAEIVENDIPGYDWDPGSSITVTVDDPSNGTGVDFTDTKTADSNGWVLFDNLGSIILAADMDIVMTDGTITKTHTVTHLVVTGVDATTDTVWGTGTPGANVNAQYCDNSGCSWRRWATVQPDGTWSTDFSVVGGSTPEEQNILNIVPGMMGEALEPVDGGITDYQWYLPNTRIGARVTEERVEGWEWPLGETVTLEINDPATPANPDYSNTAPVIIAPWDPNITWFNIDFNGLYDLKPDDEVSVTDGTTTKTHTVTNLVVTGGDPIADTVSGTADSGTNVDVWICGPGGCVSRQEVADVNGNWTADFSIPGDQDFEQATFDLQPGSNGDSGQFDDENDGTMIQWSIPNPNFGARVLEDRVEGWQWPLGGTVTVEINNPSTPANPDYTDTTTVAPAPWDPNQTWFNLDFNGQFDLKPGYVVRVTDGLFDKTHTVTTYRITSINIDADVVSGTATPGSIVDLWICDGGPCANRTETTNPSGIWSANFSVPGDQDWEQVLYNIVAGTTGDSAQWDAENDGTMIQWGMVPYGFGKIAPTNGAINVPTPVVISWEVAGQANTYQYCYDTTNDNQCSAWVNNGALTSKSLSGLLPNKTYYWQVRAVNASGVTYANNGNWWSFKTKPVTTTKTFISAGAQDGWILESSENSNKGGSMNSTQTVLNLGDGAQDKQYRVILHFDTAPLPNNAVILQATLKIRKQAQVGSNPFGLLGQLKADMHKPSFGTAALQITDFQAVAGRSNIAVFGAVPVSNWYSAALNNIGKVYVNRTGTTQFRLRFTIDDNNDNAADYIKFFSGNAGVTDRPKLVIEYYVP